MFNNLSVLVTGAAAGIGKALCEELCQRGARVYAADIQDEKTALLVDQCQGPGSIRAVHLDVSQADDFSRALDIIQNECGQLDMLVNNAGIVIGGDFLESELSDIQKIVDINLWGVIHGTRQAYKIMAQQGHGIIVNVASPAGVMPVPLSTAYSATKHAVVGFSHSLREEAALYGVKVCVVLPGMVKSDMWDSAINIKGYNYKSEMEGMGLKVVSAADAAKAILRGVENNQRNIIFPLLNRVIATLYRLSPQLLGQFFLKPLLKPLAESLAKKK